MPDTELMAKQGSASELTPAQQTFVDGITSKVGTLLDGQLPGTFQMVAYPPGFHPAVQFGASAYYNSTMLDAFNGTLEIGTNGMLTLGNQQFSTLYYNILTNATYQYSSADQKVVNDPNIANQQISVVNTATSSGFVAAYAVTPVNYPTVMGAVLKNFSADATDWSTSNISAAASKLPNAGFASLGQAIASAVQLLSPLNTILGAQSAANAELAAAMANTQKPTAANGGLPISATDYYVGWTPMPANAQIQGGLQSGSKVSIQVEASNFSSTSASLSINGKTGFSIPILDVIDIGISASSSYDWSKTTTSSSSLDMTIEYPGVTIVQIDPLPLSADYAKGWYDQSLLQSIIAGSGNADVSGFKIDPSNQYAVDKMFGKGKAFSRLKTLVVSQAPTITMVFSADQANSVTSSFKENASVDVKLFGLFSVGSFDESYSIDKVHTDTASGTVTVTFAPPEIKGTVPPEQQVCTVLGGVADYPPPS
ncbi:MULTISPECIES: hypothetical protein [Paracoccaceae]|uniref:hypothetical protein n=1 Tax=Rhodobacterales TaxID=204455 RepID=UPI001D0A6FF3|nr:hypothetical protein [Boseongicola sp. H5]